MVLDSTSSHCPRCGASVAADVRFCPACGQRLGGAQAAGGVTADPLLARVRAALLNEYDVAREIGRGGMAAVFLAEDLRLPRRVALKVMLPELAYSAVMPQRFVGEARTAAMLDHPNIVPVFHAGEQDGLRYFAMRFIDGCSLEQLPRAQGGLPIGLACHILSEVASALAYAHAVGVVHRDVKPSNVMIDRRWGRAIVTDFGIARVTDGQRLTSTGLAIGTPEYMSPEQYANDHLTGASDQYALGCVAYQLLAGRPPFVGGQAEVLIAHLREEPPSLRAQRPEVPEAVEALVARMVAKDPEARWPSLAELAVLFAEHVGGSPLMLREQLIALVPERSAEDALPQAPISPIVGVPRPGGGGASAAVPAAPPAAGLSLLDVAPLAGAASGASRLPGAVAPPPPVPLSLDSVPALQATTVTPRTVQPAGVVTQPAPTVALPPEPDALDDARDGEDDEEAAADDALGAHGPPGAALEHHRAWLQPEPGVPVTPRRRTGLLVGGGVAAAALAAVLILTTRGGSDARAPESPRGVDTAAAPSVISPTATAGDVERTDSPATPDSGAARPDSTPGPVIDPSAQRLVVVDAPQQPRRPVQLRDTLRLSARLTDGRGQAISHGGVIRWSSDAPNVVTVDQSGLLTARAPQGRANVTVVIGAGRVRVPVRVLPTVATNADTPAARAPSPPAALSADEAHRLVESIADAVREQRADALQTLFAAGQGGPSAARLLETIRKERELQVVLESRAFAGDAEHPTQRAGLKLSWKRGGLGSKLKGDRDGKTADVLVRFEREGTAWRVQSLQLEREFRP